MNLAATSIALLATCAASAQGGARSSSTAVSGGTISVEVGTNDATVEVSAAGSGHVDSHDVGPDHKATFPVPNVPPGTLLLVTVGRGLRARVIVIEVIAP